MIIALASPCIATALDEGHRERDPIRELEVRPTVTISAGTQNAGIQYAGPMNK